MSYDFTPSEFSLVWEAFNKYADPDTHILSVADLHAVLDPLVDNMNDEDITWFIKHVNAVDTGKLSLVKYLYGKTHFLLFVLVGNMNDGKSPGSLACSSKSLQHVNLPNSILQSKFLKKSMHPFPR
jgi:hypothetical protein